MQVKYVEFSRKNTKNRLKLKIFMHNNSKEIVEGMKVSDFSVNH